MSGTYYAFKRASKESFKEALQETTINVKFAEVEKIKIADTTDNAINPATKENQETMITHLSDIKNLESDTNTKISSISTNIDVALSTRASETTLSQINNKLNNLRFDPDNNLLINIAKSSIIVPADIQAHFNELDYQIITSPSASTTYYTDGVDASNNKSITFFIFADQQIEVQVQISYDGSNFRDLAGYRIASSDFIVNQENNIHIPFAGIYYRLKIITGSTAPSSIEVHWVKGN